LEVRDGQNGDCSISGTVHNMDMIEISCSVPRNYEPGCDIANIYIEIAIKTITKSLCRPLLFLGRHPSPGHLI
jgi:hypothetical protein